MMTPGRWYFVVRCDIPGPPAHHLQIIQHDHPNLRALIAFRDALRQNPPLRNAYSSLKGDLGRKRQRIATHTAMLKPYLYGRFWKPPALACHRGQPCSRRCKYLGRAYPSGEGRLASRRRVGLVSSGASNSVCTGARDGAMARVEVISGPERRRRWSAEQKRAIVAESLAPGAVVTEIARRGYWGWSDLSLAPTAR